jgi:hypothetical protein
MCDVWLPPMTGGYDNTLQLVTTIHPGVPIFDRLISAFVNRNARQLNQRHSQQPLLPSDIYEHFVLADVFRRQTAHHHDITNSQWRRRSLDHTACIEWKAEVILKIVVPAKCLFLRPIGVNNDLPIESLVKVVVAFSASHHLHVRAARHISAAADHPLGQPVSTESVPEPPCHVHGTTAVLICKPDPDYATVICSRQLKTV